MQRMTILMSLLSLVGWVSPEAPPPAADTSARDAWHEETRDFITTVQDELGEIAGLLDSTDARSRATDELLTILAQRVDEIDARVLAARIPPLTESVNFWGPGPEEVHNLAGWMPMLHNSYCRANGQTGADQYQPAPQERINFAINRIGLAPDYSGPFWIDYELYMQRGWNAPRAEVAMLTVLERVRERLPRALITFHIFGVDATLADGTRRPLDPAAELPEVVAAIDFIGIQSYQTNAQWTSVLDSAARSEARQAIAAAAGRPVVAILSARRAGVQPITFHAPDVVAARAAALLDEGVTSINYWSASAQDPDGAPAVYAQHLAAIRAVLE